MVVNKDKFKLVGLKLKGKTTNQNNQSGKDCGYLWQKFQTEKIFERIPENYPMRFMRFITITRKTKHRHLLIS